MSKVADEDGVAVVSELVVSSGSLEVGKAPDLFVLGDGAVVVANSSLDDGSASM